ncbi:uncharacterized protein LOC119685070 [Teleopsis dalmanni]|uniref:uncharacterized protein LOC119685070 n=1 Tax=Teleopsis dalmanni TaxID=139649 RepID=UPI000D32AB74|nr:uncharacterized protein LOC119685070 [Teleopsis dalmanni]
MDINIAIIEAIKMYPAIYEKNGPLGEIVGVWKKLEKMFAIPEKVIRDHWHGLLQNFCENFDFKYGDEMSFLLPHLGIEGVRTRKEWPHAIALEFNITEEDINEMDVQKEPLCMKHKTDCKIETVVVVKHYAISKSLSGVAPQFDNSKKPKLMDTVKKNDKQETVGADSKNIDVEDDIFLKILASKINDMDTETKRKTKEDILRILFPY